MTSNKFWIDNHTHINMFKERSPETVIAECDNLGIKKFINIGTDSQDHPIVLGLAHKYPEIYCTLGVHPHDAEDFTNAKEFMIKNLNDSKVVAVGEIGLDFYYDNAPRELQKQVFIEQMEIAKAHKLPVQIHTRDAEEETIEVLKKYQAEVKGVLHCFSGSKDLAKKAIEAGFNFSISGIVTFKTADELREIVKDIIPLDRIHIETDAPFLAPMPYRGKENYPGYMLETAKLVADLKGVSMEELKEISYDNTVGLFSKITDVPSS